MKIAVITLCLTIGLAEQAAADFLTWSGVSTRDDIWVGGELGVADAEFARNYWVEGDIGSAAAASLRGSSGSASISLLGDPGIRLSAFAETGPDYDGDAIYQSLAVAGAGWRDFIRVSGATSGDTLRLVFQVEGSFDIAIGFFGTGQARVGLSVYSSPTYSFADDDPFPNAWDGGNVFPVSQVWIGKTDFPVYQDFLVVDEYFTSNFQNQPDGSVTWDATFDLPYDEVLGGYSMHAYASIWAWSADGGRTEADFGSTFRLAALTQTDGSPLNGAVTFDSGFVLPSQVNPVPEPSSLTLLASGGLLGAVRLRRRKFQ